MIEPGSAQDLRFHGNRRYFAQTRTPWIRMWADWPSLQPNAAYAPGDPRSPGFRRLRALDEQIRLAKAIGLKVMLMPYRFPRWANGTAALPGEHGPDGKAFEYRLPADAYGPSSEWARYFGFLYARYHRWVDGFELVNEPNLQLWPQAGLEHEIARLLQTAQDISAAYGHATMLYAPSISDNDDRTTPRYTRYDDFVPALLDACAAIGYVPHAGQAWSHHNYTDVEKRQTETRTQLIRGLLTGRWAGHGGSASPLAFVTEGGARLSRMPDLYPDEDPRQAQAKCVRDAWELHRPGGAQGAGVAMFAQYLLYADPNFDCGLLDPFPSGFKRPAYAAWEALPAYTALPVTR